MILILLTGCKQDQLKMYQNVKYFRDFDYAKIEGVNPVDPENWDYPYVRVENLDTMIRLQYYLSEEEISYDYLHRRNGYWESRLGSIKEDKIYFFQRFYYNNLIYYLEYNIENGVKRLCQFIIKHKLSDKVIKSEYYFFNEDKELEELHWNIKYDDWVTKSIDTDSISNKTMYIKSTLINRIENTENYSINCFRFDNLPINYFWRFSYKFKRVECGS